MAWTPLKPGGGKSVSAIARRGGSVLPKLDEKDLGAFNIPHVPSDSKDGLVFWCGKSFDRYVFKKKVEKEEEEEEEVSFENLFLRVFDTKCVALTRNMADVIVLRETGSSSLRFLMFVPPQGDVEENQGHPGAWFEAVPTSNKHGLEIYALVDCGRKMQRKLVYVLFRARSARISIISLLFLFSIASSNYKRHHSYHKKITRK